MRQRRENLIRHAAKKDCDTLVAFDPENLFYMTGFWGEAVGILESDGKTTIIAPDLEAGRAQDESHDCNVVTAQRGSGLLAPLIKYIKDSSACTDCHDYSTMNMLKRSVPKITPTPVPFCDARAVKDAAELKILKKASKIIDDMFAVCAENLHVGQKESELQAILMSYAASHDMFDTGYQSTLNPLIVAGGPNGALPHAQVTGRRFRKRDLIVVDITLRYKGYVSDATRTFAIGKISPLAREAYETVRESQRLGLKAVMPDAACSDVDSACRNFIEEQGFGQYFIHSTGHGIGLQVHESPAISSISKTRLKRDMAITVEPGIYMPGKFGIRIEDSLIVKDRHLCMHKFTKKLVTV